METDDIEGALEDIDLEDEGIEVNMVHLWDIRDSAVKLDVARYYILDEDADIIGFEKDHSRGFWEEVKAINVANSINQQLGRKVRVARPSTSSPTNGRKVEWATRWNVGDKVPELQSAHAPDHKQYGDFGSW